MHITFDIIYFTEENSLLAHLQKEEKHLNPSPQKGRTPLTFASFTEVIYWVAIVAWIISLALFLSPDLFFHAILAFFGIPLFFIFPLWAISRYLTRYANHTRSGVYKNFGEKIHFTEKGISIESPLKQREMTFLYENISDFCLSYNVSLKMKEKDASSFSWYKQNTFYEYEILVNDEKQKAKLLVLLQFLYEGKYVFSELDKKGTPLHLLEYEKKQQNVSPDADIPSEYLNLIEQIGKKEEE